VKAVPGYKAEPTDVGGIASAKEQTRRFLSVALSVAHLSALDFLPRDGGKNEMSVILL